MRTLTLAGLLFLALSATGADNVEEQVRAREQERLAARERVLSLEDCIKLALEHNLDVQITRLEPELARFSLSGAYASYDPSLSLSGKHEYNRLLGTIEETDSLNGSVGGLLPWGMTYSLGASASESEGTGPTTVNDLSNPLTLFTNQYYDLVANASVTQLITNYALLPSRFAFESASANVGVLELRQPLLKNFWIDAPRLQIFLNKKNLKISELSFRAQVINTITEVEEAYYNLIFAEEAVKVQEKALELAERLVAENRRRVEVGALAPLDEKQAESQAAASRADLLATRASRDSQQRQLKSLLSDDYEDWKQARIRPTESLQAIPQHFDLQESWRKGMTERPDLLQARLGLEKQARVLKYQRNQVYPQLDLVGDLGYAGADKESSSAFRQVRRADNPFYSYGVQLTIPLGNVGARNDYKSARTTREQLELQFKQLEQNILISIENSIAAARTSLERSDATRQARLYAEEALKAEQMKLEKGKSTSFVVLDLQSKLTAARSAEIKALADYNISLARLAQNEGSTLVRRGVELKVK